jgi:hypothetical protein
MSGRLTLYGEAEAKASLKWAIVSDIVDQKPGELSMARLKPP